MSQRIVVCGAGIVGICSAIHLLKRGYQVTLLDRRGPAQETSFGNAGVISRGSVFPEASPGILKKIPGYLSNRKIEARVHYRYLPTMSPWGIGVLRNAKPDAYRANINALNILVSACLDEHKKLMLLSGAQHLLRENGWLKLYRQTQSLEASAGEQLQLTQCGIPYDCLSAAQLADIEPSLQSIFCGALLINNTASVSSPGAVGQSYADYFAAQGGKLVVDDVVSLQSQADRWRVTTGSGVLECDHVLVSMGAWSKTLLEGMGYRVPLAVERGYHMHYECDAPINRPVHDVDAGYVMSPMQRGIRVTTGVEWAAENAKPTPVQLKKVEPLVRQALTLKQQVDNEPWLGRRPCMPDSLPVIGMATRHANLWLAFGHGHMGFSMGPITGRLIAEMISGTRPIIDTAPFGLARFS
jgi:D-amino-acid dehydrogenase